jgi:glycosyltransferase involved in cell wall biosynthesis
LGHLRGIKGHEDLIDALAICRKYRDDIFCVFVGGAYRSNRYMEGLKKYARRRCGQSIKFLGERNDVPSILAGLDIAIIPSLSENFGGVGEALLSEVPTIATNVGGIPELIKNEETGILVEKKNPKMLAEAILKCLNNYEAYKKMAKRGREIVLELCDPNKNTQLLLDAYKKILAISKKPE